MNADRLGRMRPRRVPDQHRAGRRGGRGRAGGRRSGAGASPGAGLDVYEQRAAGLRRAARHGERRPPPAPRQRHHARPASPWACARSRTCVSSFSGKPAPGPRSVTAGGSASRSPPARSRSRLIRPPRAPRPTPPRSSSSCRACCWSWCACAQPESSRCCGASGEVAEPESGRCSPGRSRSRGSGSSCSASPSRTPPCGGAGRSRRSGGTISCAAPSRR